MRPVLKTVGVAYTSRLTHERVEKIFPKNGEKVVERRLSTKKMDEIKMMVYLESILT